MTDDPDYTYPKPPTLARQVSVYALLLHRTLAYIDANYPLATDKASLDGERETIRLESLIARALAADDDALAALLAELAGHGGDA